MIDYTKYITDHTALLTDDDDDDYDYICLII